MIFIYNFYFEADDFVVKFKLLGKVSRLYGDSGIGKTYVLDRLKYYTGMNKYKNNPMLQNLVIISDYVQARLLKDVCNNENIEGRLYIIDNIEAYAHDEEIIQNIRMLSYRNHVLVIGRVKLPIGVRMSDILHLEHNNNVWEFLPRPTYAYLYDRVK